MEKKPAGKILVVEDENDVRTALIDVIESFGYEVIPAIDGEKALYKLRTGETFHVILSDIRMPRMDGLKLFEGVRSLGSETPFIFLTACDDKERMAQAMRLGAFDYIDKPFKANDLESILELAMEVGMRLQKINEIKAQIAENTVKSPTKAIVEIEHLQKVIQMMRVNNQRKRKAA